MDKFARSSQRALRQRQRGGKPVSGADVRYVQAILSHTSVASTECAGIAAENGANGSVRGPQQPFSGKKNSDGTVTGTITIPYTKGGTTSQSTLNIDRNNVVNVTRR